MSEHKHPDGMVCGECASRGTTVPDGPLDALAQAYAERNALREALAVAQAQAARLREAIFWACGAVGDFPGSGDRSRGNFFWRKELRERAGITDEELNARAALAGSGEK
jgi:hypothetical protein